MRCIKKRLVILAIGLFSICMFVGCSHNQDLIEVNFDQLFPSTPFKKVLASCAKVCQDLDAFRETKHFDGQIDWQELLQDYNFFTDLLVGKLFSIKMSIATIECQRPRYHQEDIVYLGKICDEILCEYNRIFSSFKNKPKSGYVTLLIDQIKCKLDNF